MGRLPPTPLPEKKKKKGPRKYPKVVTGHGVVPSPLGLQWTSTHQGTMKDEWMVSGQETGFLLGSSYFPI